MVAVTLLSAVMVLSLKQNLIMKLMCILKWTGEMENVLPLETILNQSVPKMIACFRK